MMSYKQSMPPCLPISKHNVVHSNYILILSSLYRWSECSNMVDYSRSDLLAPVIPLYLQFFQENKIRILVYSGDVDGVVPHTGS